MSEVDESSNVSDAGSEVEYTEDYSIKTSPKTKKFSELEDGEYIIYSYIPMIGKYGRYHLIEAKYEFKDVRFYSNKRLSDYLVLYNPNRKVVINITDGKLIIRDLKPIRLH